MRPDLSRVADGVDLNEENGYASSSSSSSSSSSDSSLDSDSDSVWSDDEAPPAKKQRYFLIFMRVSSIYERQ